MPGSNHNENAESSLERLPVPSEPAADQVDDEVLSFDDIAEPRISLTAALIGVAVLLGWRFAGIRMFRDDGQSPWTSFVFGLLLPTLFVTFYPIWMIRRSGGRILENRLRLPQILIEAAIAIGVLLCVMFANAIVGMLWMACRGKPAGLPSQMQDLAFSQNILALLFMGVMACFWAPIGEELFFRRFLQRALAGRMPIVAAVGVQAVIFAVMHDYQSVHLVAITLLGAALGGLYAWRKTILASMMLHCFQNSGATALLAVLMFASSFAPVMGIEAADDEDVCRIEKVVPGSGAFDAGLQPGDVVTKFSGTPVSDFSELQMLLLLERPETTIKVEVLRNGKPMSVSVELRHRKDVEAAAKRADGGTDS